MILPCMVCGTVLESALPATIDTDNQPSDGTVFTSRGQYGSTVWDPMNDSDFIEITICDACLIKHKDRVLEGHSIRRTNTTYEAWDPGR